MLTEDACVPFGAVPTMLVQIEEPAVRHVLIANIAHAGDGNLHPSIITLSRRGQRRCGRRVATSSHTTPPVSSIAPGTWR